MLPRCSQLSWRKQEECMGGGGRTERDEDLILRQVTFEEPEDNQGISTEQEVMARGEVRAPRM